MVRVISRISFVFPLSAEWKIFVSEKLVLYPRQNLIKKKNFFDSIRKHIRRFEIARNIKTLFDALFASQLSHSRFEKEPREFDSKYMRSEINNRFHGP